MIFLIDYRAIKEVHLFYLNIDGALILDMDTNTLCNYVYVIWDMFSPNSGPLLPPVTCATQKACFLYFIFFIYSMYQITWKKFSTLLESQYLLEKKWRWMHAKLVLKRIKVFFFQREIYDLRVPTFFHKRASMNDTHKFFPSSSWNERSSTNLGQKALGTILPCLMARFFIM